MSADSLYRRLRPIGAARLPPPLDPWVLHMTPLLGALTEPWLELQVNSVDEFDARLYGCRIANDSGSYMGVGSRWIVPDPRSVDSLVYRNLAASQGLGARILARRFREHRPTLLHAHYGPNASRLTRLADTLDRPLVVSFYGYDACLVRYQRNPIWRRRYHRLFRRAGAVFAEGPAMAERLVGLGCPSDAVEVVSLPVAPENLACIPRNRAETFTVAAAGRFVEKKGFDVAIRAFADGLGPRDDATLLMIGSGPLEQTYKQLVLKLGIETRVRWMGSLPHDEFMAALATAHVALFPSRAASNGDSEGGAPVTLIEAQWLGVPAVVSLHDDLPHVSSDRTIALQPMDVTAWAETLAALYDQPSQIDALEHEARSHARTRNSPAENAKAREAVYRRVL